MSGQEGPSIWGKEIVHSNSPEWIWELLTLNLFNKLAYFEWKHLHHQNMYPGHMSFTEKSHPLKWCLKTFQYSSAFSFVRNKSSSSSKMRACIANARMEEQGSYPSPSHLLTSLWAPRLYICVLTTKCGAWGGVSGGTEGIFAEWLDRWFVPSQESLRKFLLWCSTLRIPSCLFGGSGSC